MVLKDDDVEDLAVGVNAVSDALDARRLRQPRPVRGLRLRGPPTGKPVYFIYNYKRGTWYPFVPAGGEQQRSTERELQIKAQIGAELPIEQELERWFPLWGIPI